MTFKILLKKVIIKNSGIILLCFSMNLFSCETNSQTTETDEYMWVQSKTGGGGYITGLVQNPQDPPIWYARCDVAGVFKSIDNGVTWQAYNGGMERWFHHSVRSIAIDPTNPDVLYRCSGDFRNGQLFGSIHKSTDAGNTWREMTDQIGYYGNGPARMFGELIQVDPFDADVILTAGFTGGIWMSYNAGENWEYKAAQEKSFSVVGINSHFPDIYYAAAKDGILFSSNDKGENWKIVYKNKEWHFTELLFDKRDSNIIYGATIETNVSTANDRKSVTGGIYKSIDGGRSFKKIMNGLPEEYQYNTLTAHADHPDILYTAPDARPGHTLSPVPIYISENGGDHWRLVSETDWSDLENYPTYIRSLQHVGWAISKIRIDVSNPDRVYFSNWYGVSASENKGLTWNANNFSGLETNCLENISVFGEEVYYTVADHSPMLSSDYGESFVSLPSPGLPSSTALTVAQSDPDFRLFGARNKGKSAIVALKNDDISILKDWDVVSYVQALREDPFNPGHFYAYIDGKLDQAGGLYKSIDWGESWEKLNLKLGTHIQSLPHNAEFIENELLNIVIGQRKNVVGADKLLSLDNFRKGTIYFGEWTEGIFRSDDSGISWKKVGKGLPFYNDTASVLTVIKADPNQEGRIYAGFIREGLWKSNDYGDTWQKVFPLDDTLFNVSALQLAGEKSEEIYIGSEDLYWSPCKPALMMSKDDGKTWRNVYDPSKGALRIKGLDVDSKSQRIFIATSGNGAFYVSLK
ncbi:MAG TPA: hypothetical protein VK921_01820 [Anditalea sp.]|nr:hypothetical protein [Anditalea sp.]